MFEPRPEISTATRLRSAMMRGRPAVAGAPAAGRSATRRAAPARFDLADAMHSLSGCLQGFRDLIRIVGSDDRDHADAAVEGPGQFAGLDRAARLEEGEYTRQG